MHKAENLNIVIIGNGIAGSTAALRLSKEKHCNVWMVSEETTYPYARTALMYVFMGHVHENDVKLHNDDVWMKSNIHLIQSKVDRINRLDQNIMLQNGHVLYYDKLIIATGSVPNALPYYGEANHSFHRLYHWSDLIAINERVKKGVKSAVIVGGGLIGVELAEMLLSRNIIVTMLVREASFWNTVLPPQESALINRHLLAHGINLILNDELLSASGGEMNFNLVTKKGRELHCNFVAETIGVSPNILFLKNSGLESDKGILVDEFLKTSDENIYAIGDCAQLRQYNTYRRATEAVWYTARSMGETVANTILGESNPYKQGIWFNSAKFFDVEYQIYGHVPNVDDQGFYSLFWQHDTKPKSIRIVFDEETSVVGFNLLGIRYRQSVCEKWIKDKENLREVISNLSLANFDPEFYTEYESNILSQYNERFGGDVKSTSKRSLRKVLQFLNKSKRD
jgi:NAD(P)H-nitrite reductase large subunit